MGDPESKKNYISIDGIQESNSAENSADSAGEKPLIVLEHKNALFIFVVLSAICGLYISVFEILLPVFATGSFAAIDIVEQHKIIKKIIWFCLSLFGTPGAFYILMVILLRFGTFYFYDDRLEFKSFIGRRIIIPYNKMYIFQRNMGIIISKRDKMSETLTWLHPLQRFNSLREEVCIGDIAGKEFLTGIDETKSVLRLWENYSDIPKAIQLLRERAFSFKE